MSSYRREVTVGGLVLLGIAAFFLGATWLKGTTIGGADHIFVSFDNIGTLKTGAPVRVSGAPIGRVEKIELLEFGRVIVSLTYDEEKVRPTRDGKAMLVAVGMLGDMAIDFEPGAGATITEADTLRGTVVSGLFDAAAGLTARADTVMTSLNRMFDTAIVVDLRQTLQSTDRLMTYLRDPQRGPTSELPATMRSLQLVSARLDSTLRAIDAARLQSGLDSTLASTSNMANRFAATSARLDSLLAKIERGEGTLGKLASDSTLYDEIRRTMAATAALIEEMKKDPGKIGITVKMF